MKKKFFVLAFVSVVVIATTVSGCKSADCSNSDTAEFPTVDVWWK